MKKILVAGAGHGGLTAAVHLSKNGYDVTVIEAKDRASMGHDWHDAMNMSAFDMSGIPRPSSDMYVESKAQSFRNPAGTVVIDIPFANNNEGFYIDRKVLIAYLMECAEAAGVRFLFSHKVIAPITKNNKVLGLKISDGETEIKLEADLVIDAAGLNSPVRKNLPISCGIQRTLEQRDVFHVFRAYYKNTTGEITNPPVTINMFHMNRPGIDWTITEEDFVDILIGKFGSSGALTEKEVDETLSSFRKDYPFISKEAVRGGQFADIPLTKMLPMLVCDGYAAVGDSAGMTIPLNGSGIVLSMKAGRLLADTVLKAKGAYTKKELWGYQYEYFQKLGKELILIDTLKNFFTYVDAKQVDLLTERKILTAENLNLYNGFPIDAKFISNVLSTVPRLLNLIPPLFGTFKGYPLLPLVSRYMPKEYDEERVKAWAKLYSKL